jgi:hypothetical protein
MATSAVISTDKPNEYIDILDPLAVSFVVPAGAELYSSGLNAPAQWQFDNLDSQYRDPNQIEIRLDRLNAGTFAETVVASVDSNDLSTTWLVVETPTDALDTQCRLRIIDKQTGSPIATSNYFSIKLIAFTVDQLGRYMVAS